MFTQRCFIRKNTYELVEKLKELGYNPGFSARNNYGNSLQTCCHKSHGAVYGYEDKIDDDSDDLAGGINCGTNEELFLAIAALRDDDISLNDKINEINKKYGTKIEFRR